MLTESWFLWAVGAAAFAALMTIFAKIGLSGIDSDAAQLVRTAVVLPLDRRPRRWPPANGKKFPIGADASGCS